MSLSDRAKLELLLSSCGVARNDEVDESVLEFLFEALKSKTLTNNEKAEWLMETIPPLQRQPRQVVLDIIAAFCSPQVHASAAEAKSTVSLKGTVPTSKKKEELPDLTDIIANDVRATLLNSNLEGSDIIEKELVEYLMTFVAELQIDDKSASSSYILELEGVLMSFFTDLSENPDALRTIVDILIAADVDRKKSIKSDIINVSEKTAPSSIKTSDKATSSSTDKSLNTIVIKDGICEEDSPQMRDDIESLISMMPYTSKDLIRYVYTILCGANRIEAARYLVERSDTEAVEKLQLSKDIYDKKERESASLLAIQKKKMKATVCSKYGDLLVRDKFDVKGKEVKTKIPLPMQFIDEKDKEKKVKFSNFIVLNTLLNICLNLSCKLHTVVRCYNNAVSPLYDNNLQTHLTSS